MNRRWLLFALAATVPALAAPLNTDQAALVDRLAPDARIVFLGRVEKVHASNLKALAPTPATVLVHVDEVIDVPASLAGIRGQAVVVQLAQPESMRQDEQAIFFSTGLLYGEHLAVREIGRLPPSVDIDSIKKELQAVRDRAFRAALAARVSSAALIFTGKVARVNKPKEPPRRGEHDLDLARAAVQVTAALKGSAKGTVTITFTPSGDEAWLRSPKLTVGEEAVFLTHAEPQLKLPPGNYVLDPLDVQPLEQAATIKALVAGGGR
jgi:hypothetical protein